MSTAAAAKAGSPRPAYLACPSGPVFGFLHPVAEASSSTGVLLISPFGWEDVCSYRSRRAWAQELAAAGHPTFRFDLPGTGDSAGLPGDDDLVGLWAQAIASAATWLREETGCAHVAGIGLGLGGLVLAEAVIAGAAVDDLVLWAVQAQGRKAVRELRAFAQMADSQFADPRAAPAPPLPEGWLNASGFALAPGTIAALERIDLTASPLPHAAGRRVLLLGRDGRVDAKLRASLERSGAALSVEDGEGYRELMTTPQAAQTPRPIFASTIRWLAQAGEALPAAQGGAPAQSPGVAQAEIDAGGARVTETALSFSHEGRSLFGILTEPVGVEQAPVTAVLLNAGAVRRIGPNRMWVEAARRWAGLGVPTLRFDLEGLGDADGAEEAYVADRRLYQDHLVDQVITVLDELQARGLPPRFVVVGLCSGAYHGLHAALRDARIAQVALLNLVTFFWDESLIADREAARLTTLARDGGVRWLTKITPRRVWRLLKVLPSHVWARLRGAAGHPSADRIAGALDTLRDGGTRTLLVFSRGEPLYDEMGRDGYLATPDRWPGLRVETIPHRDHTFRPLWVQERVSALLDEELDAAAAQGTRRVPLRRQSARA